MRQTRGFTLIELLTVVALISIMLGLAVPSFRSFIANYRITAAANDFLQGVTQTRAEALKRGRRVLMMPNNALGVPSISGDWKYGWTIFVDLNNNQVLDSSDVLVSKHLALDTSTVPTNYTGSGVAFTDPTAKVYVSFDGTGYPRFISGGLEIGGIMFSDTSVSTPPVRTLCIESMGAARIYQGTTSCT